MRRMIAIVAGLTCMFGIAGCDNTYTPGLHRETDASTGSRLSGTDTGANDNGNTNNPSITSNLGNGAAAHGH